MDWSYTGIKTEIKNRLKQNSNWANTLFFVVLERFIDAISYILDKNLVYMEYLINESKWSRARNRTSLLYQTPYLNYIPHRKTGARGFIELSTNKDFNTIWNYIEELVNFTP